MVKKAGQGLITPRSGCQTRFAASQGKSLQPTRSVPASRLSQTLLDHAMCRRAWQPTPVFLPGEFHGQRNPVGSRPWGRKSRPRLSDSHALTLTHSITPRPCSRPLHGFFPCLHTEAVPCRGRAWPTGRLNTTGPLKACLGLSSDPSTLEGHTHTHTRFLT